MLAVLLLAGTYRTQAQVEIVDGDSVYLVVDKLPEFPGGFEEMVKFVGTNLHHPGAVSEGRVIVNFIINKVGEITHPRVVRGLHPEMDEAALDVVRMMPMWKPGEQDGQRVNVRFTLPIVFRTDASPIHGAPASSNILRITDPLTPEQQALHLPLSQGLHGIWNLSEVLRPNGNSVKVRPGTFKIINKDGTVYTLFAGLRHNDIEILPPHIGFYGTYQEVTDSTFTETTVQNFQSPGVSGVKTELKYKLIDSNTLHSFYRPEGSDGSWMGEVWKRVTDPVTSIIGAPVKKEE